MISYSWLRHSASPSSSSSSRCRCGVHWKRNFHFSFFSFSALSLSRSIHFGIQFSVRCRSVFVYSIVFLIFSFFLPAPPHAMRLRNMQFLFRCSGFRFGYFLIRIEYTQSVSHAFMIIIASANVHSTMAEDRKTKITTRLIELVFVRLKCFMMCELWVLQIVSRGIFVCLRIELIARRIAHAQRERGTEREKMERKQIEL